MHTRTKNGSSPERYSKFLPPFGTRAEAVAAAVARKTEESQDAPVAAVESPESAGDKEAASAVDTELEMENPWQPRRQHRGKGVRRPHLRPQLESRRLLQAEAAPSSSRGGGCHSHHCQGRGAGTAV